MDLHHCCEAPNRIGWATNIWVIFIEMCLSVFSPLTDSHESLSACAQYSALNCPPKSFSSVHKQTHIPPRTEPTSETWRTCYNSYSCSPPMSLQAFPWSFYSISLEYASSSFLPQSYSNPPSAFTRIILIEYLLAFIHTHLQLAFPKAATAVVQRRHWAKSLFLMHLSNVHSQGCDLFSSTSHPAPVYPQHFRSLSCHRSGLAT